MPDRPTLPVEVRADLIDTLRLDLVGPTNAGPLATEELPEFPSRWYLTGFLVPGGASLEQRSDAESDDTLDEVNNNRHWNAVWREHWSHWFATVIPQ